MKESQEIDFDVIVVGSGISGGWAAKEFSEKGFKTLVLERGRDVKHIKDYPTAMTDSWEFRHRNAKTQKDRLDYDVSSKHYAFSEATKHFYVPTGEQDYIQEKPFDWIRAYQVGGRSLLWARQTQRWSDFEFQAPQRFGYGVDWPIRYADLAPWYSHVEKYIGISGNRDGIANMPDSEVVGSFEMNQVEKLITQSISSNYSDRQAIIGRCANLSSITQTQIDQGRTKCMARSMCERGCPFGAYFSSNSSTIPAALKTGNLTLITDSVVEHIVYDEKLGRATGVQVVDAKTNARKTYRAKVIFLNASTLNTNFILLNSRSERFPNGLGNDSDILGKYVTFHNYRGTLRADFPGHLDSYYYGRRPTQIFIPAFRNIYQAAEKFKGTYLVAYNARRGRATNMGEYTVGASYKDALLEPSGWVVSMMMQGEVLPVEENHVRLSASKKDKYGQPQLITSVAYTDNDVAMMEDFFEQGSDMLERAGCLNIAKFDRHKTEDRQPGLDVHEMGGVRMGHSPLESMLNKHNQVHACKNVFVTDGACMISTGNQNPSLTYMALTVRAVDFAVSQLRDHKL